MHFSFLLLSPSPLSPVLLSVPEPKDLCSIDIGEVQQLEKIEKGSFGEIFKASWRGTIVALKKSPSANLTSPLIKELKREATLMKSLRHPNVLQFLGTTTDPRDNDFVIIMEFMPRGSLYRIIHNMSVDLPLERIKNIALDAARGMNYLHNLTPPIIHRDFKSHNLLVDLHWKVKVCDFGLSKMIEEANATMTACGTPAWTAPEVLRNERYTAKADVYSFGVVLWELFSREDPFPGIPPFQVVFIVGNQGRRPAIQPHWPPEWIQLIVECWSENPSLRPSYDAILAKLTTM
jgi:serine/threonine protein kinase